MKLLKLVPDNTNIDFMRWRNVALVLQIALVIAALALVWVKGLNLGIDFVGGQVVRATFAQPVDIEELRGKVGTLNVGEASIQEFGDNKTYQIRLPRPEGPEPLQPVHRAVGRAMQDQERRLDLLHVMNR